jgi:putative ABC transport system permease protein
VASDALHAWRAVAQRPAISLTIVGTLAVALAANATIFTLADALYLRPFRFPGADRLVIVSSAPNNDPAADHSSVAPADFRDWERESTVLTGFAAAAFWDPNLSGIEDPEQVPGFRVSPKFFRTIGVEPLLGRTFADTEATPGEDRRVVLSHGLWIRRFGSDPSIVGRTLRFDGEPHEVVGVMRPGTAVPYGADVWAPLAYSDEEWADRKGGGLLVMARLADGQEIGAARAEMAAIVERQRQAYPDTNAKRGSTVVTITRGLADGFAAPLLAIWQAAALLLLAIASANIANLLLAQGAERQQEFAVRLALGAGRGRIARQLLFEGAWRALAAVVLTIPLAMAGVESTRRSLPPGIHRWVAGIDFIRVDIATLAVTLGLGAVAMVLFSWLPAVQASRAAVSDTLRQGGRTMAGSGRRNWLGVGLASGQVALALALVVGAGLVLGGIDRAVNGTLGFDKRNVIAAQLRLTTPAYESAERRRQFSNRVLERLRGIPAVETLAVSSSLPYTAGFQTRPIHPEGQSLTDAEVREARWVSISPDYLDVMRIPLLEGRRFSDADREDTPQVTIVSRAFAERYWPGGSPIGRRFRTSAEGPWLEVVGVSGDVVQDLLLDRGSPTYYRPIPQQTPFATVIVARTTADPLALSGELRRAVFAADPDQPILELRSLEQVVAERAGGIMSFARLLAGMGIVALVLALVGIYSLMAYVAAGRTREFGVRMALGATRGHVVRLSLRQAAIVTVCGLVAGTGLAIALSQVMSTAMFGLVSFDVASIAMITAALGVTVMAAGWLPAHRASRMEPTDALRTT